MICLFIFQSSYGAPSGCDRMVVCQLAQGDPKMIHCGNYYISCMYTSITVYEAVLVPSVMKVQARFCPSLEKVQSRLSSFWHEGSSQTIVPRSRLVDLRHPFLGDVFSSCFSLLESMLPCTTVSSWCRMRIFLAPRCVCQSRMALVSMGELTKLQSPLSPDVWLFLVLKYTIIP